MERGPQFKVFHGDQGTLFNQQEHAAIQAQRVIPNEDRYPRGFTPDRYRAVREHLGGRSMEENLYGGLRRLEDTDNHGFRVPQNHAKDRGFLARREGQARVVETIARSTAPIEHIATNTPSIWQRGSEDARGASGRYFSKGHGANTGSPIIEIYGQKKYDWESEHGDWDGEGDPPVPTQRRGKQVAAQRPRRVDSEQTLLHELGHHASAVEATPHNVLTSHRSRGEEEAYADDYMTEHWKADPRDVRRGTNPDWERRYAGYDSLGKEPRNPYIEKDASKDEQAGAQRFFAEGYRAKRRFPATMPQRPQMPTLFESQGTTTYHSETAYGGRSHDNHWRVSPNVGRQFGG